MQSTMPKMLREVAKQHPDVSAQYFKDGTGRFQSVSYSDLYETILNVASGLLHLGVKRGDHVGIISDDRKEWQEASMAIMGLGAADVPRGCDATNADLSYILSFAECEFCFVENQAQVEKCISIREAIPNVKTLIVFDLVEKTALEAAKKAGFSLIQYSDVIEKGKKEREKTPGFVESEIDAGGEEDIACIIFTSGTTGEPKGVMLCHRNFLTQLDELPELITLSPGDKALCVLPVWHSFQRLCEYMILFQAGSMCYSKPIGSILLADFAALNPQVLPAVPRVFEAVYEGVLRTMRKGGGIKYLLFKFFVGVGVLHSKIDRLLLNKTALFKKRNRFFDWLLFVLPWLFLYPFKLLGSVLVFKKIREKLGNRFHVGVSGGGALPPIVDEFFWAVGINIVEGYGLTETAPVISVRSMHNPTFGTVGYAIRGVEAKIVDEDGRELGPGQKGTLMIKGGTVMKGYYKKPGLTAEVLSEDGWLDTGDLGLLTIDGQLVIRGRKKDTIVLRGGENVEPLPLEMRMMESRFIAQAVVLGQDERYLAAMIVPSRDDVESYAKEKMIDILDFEKLLEHDEIQKLFETEIKELVNAKSGFKIFERISRFVLLKKPFEQGVELSAKQEVMRYKLPELYPKEMKLLFK